MLRVLEVALFPGSILLELLFVPREILLLGLEIDLLDIEGRDD
jgi:hypothetical protein